MSKPLRFIAVKADQDAQDTNSEVEKSNTCDIKKVKTEPEEFEDEECKEDKKELVPSPSH